MTVVTVYVGSVGRSRQPFGIQVEYPEDNLPVDTGGHLPDAETASRIRHIISWKKHGPEDRLTEIKENSGKERR